MSKLAIEISQISASSSVSNFLNHPGGYVERSSLINLKVSRAPDSSRPRINPENAFCDCSPSMSTIRTGFPSVCETLLAQTGLLAPARGDLDIAVPWWLLHDHMTHFYKIRSSLGVHSDARSPGIAAIHAKAAASRYRLDLGRSVFGSICSIDLDENYVTFSQQCFCYPQL